MTEVNIKNYLNNVLIKGYTWHLVGTFTNHEFNLYAYSIGDGLKSLLDNMGIEYKRGTDRIYIRTKDVLAYIKSKDREDKINKILND